MEFVKELFSGMRRIIDRFEGPFAVVEGEGRKMVQIPREDLPKEAREGDAIVYRDGEYQVDDTETEKRRKKIEELSRDLWE